MSRKIYVDVKCHELACQLLSDDPQIDSAENRYDLAAAIQVAIEDTIEQMKWMQRWVQQGKVK